MKHEDDLKALRASVQSELEDSEFEQFAVSLGCAPQHLSELNESVSSGRHRLQEIDSQIGRAETAERERQLAAAERRRRRLRISDADVDTAFAELVARARS